MNVKERFGKLVEEFAGSPGVAAPTEANPRRFGSQALKVNGSIFAMLTGGRLVLKLPQDRVHDLIASGTGAPFDSGKGRPMKEWLTVIDDDEETWRILANEALDFVRARSQSR